MNISEKNNQAWNHGAYEAWINRFGSPAEMAKKIAENPQKRVGEIFKYLGDDVANKKIINLLGSNGVKAVALGIMGAKSSVVDFSIENERYAKELSNEAQVELRYIVSDVLRMPASELTADYDIVFMEQGILHYFTNLDEFFNVVVSLLKRGGRMILHDFHPISTKLISSKGTTANIRKHKVTGSYFDASLIEQEIAFSKYTGGDAQKLKVYLRNWTLGEVITAVASSGLCIKLLNELPNQSSEVFDAGIPKSFVIVAEKL